ncbi:MAG: DUF4359 domain-containing protein [Nitrospiraceae bacterium]
MKKQQKKSGMIVGGVVVVALGGLMAFLALTNPAMADYQEVILTPAAEKRASASASDAMLVSILQSVPMGADSMSGSEGQDQSGMMNLLMSRTHRSNYMLFSIYTTEYDYCEGQAVNRDSTTMIGIAGGFHMWDDGECPVTEGAAS